MPTFNNISPDVRKIVNSFARTNQIIDSKILRSGYN